MPVVLALWGMFKLADFASAATRTFTDDSGDGLFSDAANWDGHTTIPSNNDSLILGLDAGGSGLFGLDTGSTFSTPSLTFSANASAWTITALVQAQDVLNINGTGTTIQNLSANHQTTTLVTFSLGATQTWDGGAHGLSVSNIDLGNNQTLTFTGTGTTPTTENIITSAIVGTGTSGIVKQGAGTLLFGSQDTNSYLGATTVAMGILQLGKSNPISGNAAGLVMAGGTLNLAGFSQAFTTAAGTLSLTGNSFIDFGSGSNSATLTLADSSALLWNGFTLTLLNYNAGDTLKFGNTNMALTAAQLADIHLGIGGPTAGITSTGIIVPEPTTGLLFGFGLIPLFARCRGRKH